MPTPRAPSPRAKPEGSQCHRQRQTKASHRFGVTPPDVKAVREQIGLSQSEFARLMRVSIKTLQNWEQHHRNPTGPAAALLKIVSTAPEVALKSLHA